MTFPPLPPDERIDCAQEAEMRLGASRYCRACGRAVELWVTKPVGPVGWRVPPVYLLCPTDGIVSWKATASTQP